MSPLRIFRTTAVTIFPKRGHDDLSAIEYPVEKTRKKRGLVLKLVFQFGSALEEKEDEAAKHFAETRVHAFTSET
jgi:hypothetical protein